MALSSSLVDNYTLKKTIEETTVISSQEYTYDIYIIPHGKAP